MCGIAGLLQWERGGRGALEALEAMTASMAHRGPDGEGTWYDPDQGVGLGHRRLAILDLSPRGAQPMVSPSGRYRITYNGEIYNYRTLARELSRRGYRFRGSSDTEVLLTAIEEWGVELAVPKLNGMFAFGVWDEERRELSLVRDRFGIKPLYYGRIDGAWVFASELKALRAHPAFSAPVDRDAITAMMRVGVVPEPLSIYRGIRKQRRGTRLTFPADGGSEEPRETEYWSVGRAAEAAAAQRFSGTEEDAVDALQDLLRDSVALRMRADVPVGAFLSGGVDSSMVVALMQEASSAPVHTFTVEFDDPAFDESAYAREVAGRLGTAHIGVPVSSAEALELIPELHRVFDEPFADSSQIPTILVSRIARRKVTVALAGDGGDELFGGYNRHTNLLNLYQRYRMPLGLLGIPIRATLGGRSPAGIVRRAKPGQAWWRPALKGHTPAEVFLRRVSYWRDPESVVLGGREPRTPITDWERWPHIPNFGERMMQLDAATYLPDDLLVKLDRSSMAVSLEARVPFLDHRVAEFAWSLPLEFRITPTENKRVLRRVLGRYLPAPLFERPKMGFSIPLAAWLRGPLRDWAEDLLSERRLQESGIFDSARVRQRWDAHLNHDLDFRNSLWAVLMVQSWLAETDA